MTKKPPVVQARALETRAKILAQAEKAFATHGFDGTSLTSDILEPAGVSVGSFYHQFDNKRDVLFALFEERLPTGDDMAERVVPADHASFGDGVRSAMIGLLDDIDTHPESWWLQYRERLSPDPTVRETVAQRWQEWMSVITATLERWYDVSVRDAGVAGGVVARALGGLTREYLLADESERRRLRHEAIDPTVEFCVAGVERLIGQGAVTA